jgi:hypothetical protein
LHLRRVALIWRKSPWTAFRIIEKLRIIESTPEECVTMALSVQDDDKALWLTLAQSWVRLAEQVAYVESNPKRRRKTLRMKLIEFRGGASQPDEDQRHL